MNENEEAKGFAGRTGLKVGTRVRVTRIASGAPDDRMLVGIEGEITHPFPGLMTADPSRYVAGLAVDEAMCLRHEVRRSRPDGGTINLTAADGFEPLA